MEKTITEGRVDGSVLAPSSKSYAQRAVAAALLAGGESLLANMELCNDTRAAMGIAADLGAVIRLREGTKWDYYVHGIGTPEGSPGLCPGTGKLNVGESGLATRLFTPIAALCDKSITLTGEGSILRRPIDMMEGPLSMLGAKVSTRGGFLPVTVCGPLKGGEAWVDGSLSSQFITGLLMALPLAEHDTVLHVKGLKSRPYIDMTVNVARSFGIEIGHNDYEEFFVEGGQRYKAASYNVEGDWSGASCLLVAGAIAGSVTVENMNTLSLQADVAIIEALSRAGAEIVSTQRTVSVRERDLTAFEFDATHCPDLFPALVALAAHCDGESVLRGTHRLTHKESNRAATLQQEFSNLGIEIDLSEKDIMRVRGGKIHGATVESHNDHRIAMALATAALTADSPVVVRGAEAVGKSYPDFWDDLEAIRVKE